MTGWGWVGECGGSKPTFWKKIAYEEGAKKVKKTTNNSAFSATHTYIKLTLVSFFYFFYAPSPYLPRTSTMISITVWSNNNVWPLSQSKYSFSVQIAVSKRWLLGSPSKTTYPLTVKYWGGFTPSLLILGGKLPQSVHLLEGRGVKALFGRFPFERRFFWQGLP